MRRLLLLTALLTLSALVGAQAQNDSVDIYAYRSEELRCDNNGESIYGLAYIPEGLEQPFPTIVFSHGYGGTHESGATLAQFLVTRGIAVYTYDFRGGSARSQSDGNTTEMSVLTEADDLNAVIETLQAQSFVDEKSLFLFGESQGGIVSAIVAASRPEDIRGLILQYPAFVIGDDMHKMYASLVEIDDTVDFMGMSLGRAYYADMWDYDVYEHIGAYTSDVLIFHGDGDQLVPLSYSQQAAEVYDAAQLEIFPGQGHGFDRNYMNAMLQMTYGYIVTRIE